MSGERRRRVAEEIQRFLSQRLISELRDSPVGFATVTGVDLSPDLKSARVFVTVYGGDEAKRAQAVASLNRAAGHFRHEIGQSLRLRHTPILEFEVDESIERADRIERLIREIHEEEAERPTPAVDEQAHPDESE